MTKQVDPTHYAFDSYESAERFTSYYHQVKAALELKPQTLLEVGVGSRIFLDIARALGIEAYGMDIDMELRPSFCGSILGVPLMDGAVDVAAAFQILEHLPFESFTPALQEGTVAFPVEQGLPDAVTACSLWGWTLSSRRHWA